MTAVNQPEKLKAADLLRLEIPKSSPVYKYTCRLSLPFRGSPFTTDKDPNSPLQQALAESRTPQWGVPRTQNDWRGVQELGNGMMYAAKRRFTETVRSSTYNCHSELITIKVQKHEKKPTLDYVA